MKYPYLLSTTLNIVLVRLINELSYSRTRYIRVALVYSGSFLKSSLGIGSIRRIVLSIGLPFYLYISLSFVRKLKPLYSYRISTLLGARKIDLILLLGSRGYYIVILKY